MTKHKAQEPDGPNQSSGARQNSAGPDSGRWATLKREFVALCAILAIGLPCGLVSARADDLSDKGSEYQRNAADRAKRTQSTGVLPNALSATTVTLSNGSGDGSVSVTVDAYGSFGSSTPANDAFYDPIGSIGPAGTVYESGLFFGPLGNFLTSDSFGAALPLIPFIVVTETFAQSAFDIAGYHILLTQQLSPVGPGGSTLTQEYSIANNTGAPASFNVVRHVDGDLYFNGTFSNDFGGVSGDGQTIFEFDGSADPNATTASVGITGSGGNPVGYTIQSFRFNDNIISAHGIPTTVLNTVGGDSNGDGVTDFGYDVTLSLERVLTVGAGATVTYVTKTIFGQGATGQIAFDVLDPNPDLLDNNGQVISLLSLANVDKLVASNVTRSGVVADGVTQLLLRVESGAPVTFSLASGNPADGSLKLVGSAGSGSMSVNVSPVQDSNGKFWAFALYTSPIDFSAAVSTNINRIITLQASEAFGTIQKSLSLERPPVVLVHGLWSEPAVWLNSGFRTFLKTQGFVVKWADYRCNPTNDDWSCAETFDASLPIPNNKPVYAVQKAVSQAQTMSRSRGVAVTQVDVIGHSMGGLATRAYIARRDYKGRTNFMAGDIHKLITLGSPHLGSELADFLADHQDELVINFSGIETAKDEMRDFGRPIDAGAVEALRPFSDALLSLGTTPVPGHAIVGISGDGKLTEGVLNSLICVVFGRCGSTVDSLLGEDNDTIVGTESQSGSLHSSNLTSVINVVHADIAPTDVSEIEAPVQSSEVGDRVLELLRSSVYSDFFTDCWPEPFTDTLCQQSLTTFGQGQAGIPNNQLLKTGAQDVPKRLVPRGRVNTSSLSGVTLTSPLPGSIFHPGDAITLTAVPVGGATLTQAVFLIEGGEIIPIDSPPFAAVASV